MLSIAIVFLVVCFYLCVIDGWFLGYFSFFTLLLSSSAWRNAGETKIQRPGLRSLAQPTVAGNDGGRLLERASAFTALSTHKSTTGRTVNYVFGKSGSVYTHKHSFFFGDEWSSIMREELSRFMSYSPLPRRPCFTAQSPTYA